MGTDLSKVAGASTAPVRKLSLLSAGGVASPECPGHCLPDPGGCYDCYVDCLQLENLIDCLTESLLTPTPRVTVILCLAHLSRQRMNGRLFY
jgi:hypothetical protein